MSLYANEYTADDVEVLRFPQAIRQRTEMYIGSRERAGLHWLLEELLTHALNDLPVAGPGREVRVELLPGDGCRVTDNGPGLTVPNDPYSILDPVPRPPGRFWRVGPDLYGSQLRVLCALSQRLEGQVQRAGQLWQFALERGEWTEVPHVVGSCTTTGTTLTFWPEPTIFTTTTFDRERVRDRLRELAGLNPGVALTCTDGATSETVHFPEGVAELVAYRSRHDTPFNANILRVCNEDTTHRLDVAWQWVYDAAEVSWTFANGAHTWNGGPHQSGFRTALTNALNSWCRQRGREELAPALIRCGLVAVLSLDLPDPRYGGATKSHLTNPEASEYVRRPVQQEMEAYLAADAARADALCDHLLRFRDHGWDPQRGYYLLPQSQRWRRRK